MGSLFFDFGIYDVYYIPILAFLVHNLLSLYQNLLFGYKATIQFQEFL